MTIKANPVMPKYFKWEDLDGRKREMASAAASSKLRIGINVGPTFDDIFVNNRASGIDTNIGFVHGLVKDFVKDFVHATTGFGVGLLSQQRQDTNQSNLPSKEQGRNDNQIP